MDDLFRLALNNAAWATGLAVVAAVGSRVWRSRPALAHALWHLVLLKLVTPSILKIAQPWSGTTGASLQAVEQPSTTPRLAASAPTDTPPSPRSVQSVAQKRSPSLGRSNAEPEQTASANEARSTMRSWPWRTVIALVWLSGAGFWWGFVALSLIRFRRLLDSASAAPAELEDRVRQVATRMELAGRLVPTTAIVPARVAPMVWASFFSPPRLMLPEELWGRLDASQQDAVLAHELAHLKRRDHWVRWLETVVLGFYWWDPVAWWARREVERTEEEACDAWVLWSQPGAAGAYAEALVATTAFLSGLSRPLPLGASGVRNALSLKRRLRMILSDVENAPMIRSRSWKLLAVGAVCLPLLPAPTSGKTQDRAAGANPSQTPFSDARAKSSQPPTAAPRSAPQKNPDRVRVSRPIIRQVSEYADVEPTRLQPANRVALKAQVGGMIQRVACKPGQRVKKGEVLFEIDSRTYTLELQKAEAEVRRLQSRVRAIGVQYRAGDRDKRVQDVHRVQADSEEAEALLLGAQATLDLAKLKLDSTKVTAPFDAVIIRVVLSDGDFVEAGKTDLATIVTQGLLYADVFVDEATAQRIDRARLKRETSSGVSVRFGVRDEEGFPHSASIDFVDPEAQSIGVRLRFVVKDPDGSFRPGSMARVRVILGPPREALLIPENVIEVQVDRRYVGVLNDKNIVERRRIRVGQRYDDLRAVESGLRADEWVILDRAAAARLGEKVPANNIDRTDASPQSAKEPSAR